MQLAIKLWLQILRGQVNHLALIISNGEDIFTILGTTYVVSPFLGSDMSFPHSWDHICRFVILGITYIALVHSERTNIPIVENTIEKQKKSRLYIAKVKYIV